MDILIVQEGAGTCDEVIKSTKAVGEVTGNGSSGPSRGLVCMLAIVKALQDTSSMLSIPHRLRILALSQCLDFQRRSGSNRLLNLRTVNL